MHSYLRENLDLESIIDQSLTEWGSPASLVDIPLVKLQRSTNTSADLNEHYLLYITECVL